MLAGVADGTRSVTKLCEVDVGALNYYASGIYLRMKKLSKVLRTEHSQQSYLYQLWVQSIIPFLFIQQVVDIT
jgi:hypothetical protein